MIAIVMPQAREVTRLAAVKISVMRSDLKAMHGLTQSEVRSNLTYLISEGWVEEQQVVKNFATPRGGIVPSPTSYYIITAAGIDKIEGPGEFTMDRFHGIKIEATGQNIITVGDGNQVNAKFADAAQELADLKDEVRSCAKLEEQDKVDLIGDIDSIQSQLAKPSPNRKVITALWKSVEKVGKLAGFTNQLFKASQNLGNLIEL